jgi:peptidoglycan/xylan/chitin deacetylase (PgdA/CDA1 family)
MDIEHFGLLSSVIRKTESHEQDGETLRANARIKRASGDPAMALLFQSVGTDGRFRPAYSAAAHSTGLPPTMRDEARLQRARRTARETLQRRMPSLSINVL